MFGYQTWFSFYVRIATAGKHTNSFYKGITDELFQRPSGDIVYLGDPKQNDYTYMLIRYVPYGRVVLCIFAG